MSLLRQPAQAQKHRMVAKSAAKRGAEILGLGIDRALSTLHDDACFGQIFPGSPAPIAAVNSTIEPSRLEYRSGRQVRGGFAYRDFPCTDTFIALWSTAHQTT
jgi:hypothetical protein